ncbi:DUF6446 family protein [Pseudooceanicola onchidii]|uniref:DUF6446 family protein n=1 Tax=Pseudooceanicola onchidii TaxID=2562279 RepID=UPI0010AB0E77|nr:DUF6446 family protein [Pseudooceanicola onchidii]
MGKFLAAMIVVCALAAGGGIYYLQVYGYYDTVAPTGSDVVLTTIDGHEEVIPYEGFEAIDADSSPIRYRACFRTDLTLEALEAVYLPYEDAVPLEAPGWFGCYSADGIGEALEAGKARAFLSVENVHYGVDRIVAIFPDGHGYVWHQINPCGEVVFDGRPAPEGCPPPPQ